MAYNNNDIYNTALVAAFGGAVSNRSEKSVVAANYTDLSLACQAYATELDSLIPTIGGGASAAQLDGIYSLSYAAWANRQPTDLTAANYATVANVVKAQWTQITSLAV